ncbi:MAG: hypothetical protein F4129_08245 [Acidimicrobiia bacterium]|nr:hypothetical protein [bacterium]MXZ85272.1 hypothetical protein [Acidimicrobiia bacterium]MYG71367.1 hypothetical protein [Acidimicrobiia bacterium]MYH96484.1 hypothetical protein [Acidimicrobiia bacterium]
MEVDEVTVSQQKLLSVIRDRVDQIDESDRVPGYRRDLLETLAQIVVLEKEHLEAKTQIQKKINDQAQALGTILHKAGWEPS